MRTLLWSFMLWILSTPVVIAQSEQDFIAQAKQALQQQHWDTAEEAIEEAYELAPENAEVNYLRGNIMGAQAGQSIFSALGYAKKSRQSFARAVELEPSNIRYREGLFQFYLIAPGMVGGDDDKAWEQVQEITKLDEKAGLLVELDFARATKDAEEFSEQLEQALTKYSQWPDIWFAAGLYAQQNERANQAFDYFRKALTRDAPDERSERALMNARYQLGRTAAVSRQFEESALRQALKELDRYQQDVTKLGQDEVRGLPSAEWAQLRQAMIYRQLNQEEDAEALMSALAQSDDPRLREQLSEL